MNFTVIIPARFASRRLPGKPLADINGKPMVVRVMERAQISGADRVIVATDHQSVINAVKRIGGEAYLTSPEHQSGIERLQEIINRYNFSDDQIIVNLQCDEPLIPPQIISQVADDLAVRTEAEMATLAVPISSKEEAYNPNIVKVVLNAYGYALYFSRATIPWYQEGFIHNHNRSFHNLLRHIGIYAYHANFIRRYVKWSTSPLEQIETLEQLRVLWYGEKIYVAISNVTTGIGVDTPEELAQVRLLYK